jgi:hypothetical protein
MKNSVSGGDALRKYKKIFKKISAGTANDEFLCAGHHFSQAQNDLIHTQR